MERALYIKDCANGLLLSKDKLLFAVTPLLQNVVLDDKET